MLSLFAVFFALIRNAFADRGDLLLENLALRQQLAVHQRRKRRLKLASTDRIFWVWLSRFWPNWRSALLIVQPETVIHWHHQAWKRYWTWKSRHPRTGCEAPVFNPSPGG